MDFRQASFPLVCFYIITALNINSELYSYYCYLVLMLTLTVGICWKCTVLVLLGFPQCSPFGTALNLVSSLSCFLYQETSVCLSVERDVCISSTCPPGCPLSPAMFWFWQVHSDDSCVGGRSRGRDSSYLDLCTCVYVLLHGPSGLGVTWLIINTSLLFLWLVRFSRSLPYVAHILMIMKHVGPFRK